MQSKVCAAANQKKLAAAMGLLDPAEHSATLAGIGNGRFHPSSGRAADWQLRRQILGASVAQPQQGAPPAFRPAGLRGRRRVGTGPTSPTFAAPGCAWKPPNAPTTCVELPPPPWRRRPAAPIAGWQAHFWLGRRDRGAEKSRGPCRAAGRSTMTGLVPGPGIQPPLAATLSGAIKATRDSGQDGRGQRRRCEGHACTQTAAT